jgi:hypothetical protein
MNRKRFSINGEDWEWQEWDLGWAREWDTEEDMEEDGTEDLGGIGAAVWEEPGPEALEWGADIGAPGFSKEGHSDRSIGEETRKST